MRIRTVRERRTGRPRRSRPGAALSVLPRPVTVLGLVLVLAELAGGAVLLAAGPHRAAVPQAGTRTVQGHHGRMQTVLLRVDGVPLANNTCTPAPRDPCGPEVAYFTTMRHVVRVPGPVRLPFTRKIQVQAGQSLRLNTSSRTDGQITCSVTVDGSVLSQITELTPSSSQSGTASCHTTIPDSGTSTGAARRMAVLRVAPVPGATCQDPSGCGTGVDYATPAGDATNFSAAVPFIAKVPVPPGGIVTLSGINPAEDLACSITVGGKVLSQATARNALDTAACHGMVPGAETAAARPGGTQEVDLWVTFVPIVPESASGAEVAYTTPAGGKTVDDPVVPFHTTVAVRAGGSVTISGVSGSRAPVTCSLMADGRVLSQVTTHDSSGRAICQARIP